MLPGAWCCMHMLCAQLVLVWAWCGGTELQAAHVSLTQNKFTIKTTHVWLSDALEMPLCAGQ
jgi:hypothetical protein